MNATASALEFILIRRKTIAYDGTCICLMIVFIIVIVLFLLPYHSHHGTTTIELDSVIISIGHRYNVNR